MSLVTAPVVVTRIPSMVDMPAATIPAIKMDARNGFSPLWRIIGTIWSAFSIFWMEAMPFTPAHSISVAEKNMPSVPRRIALNIVLWSFIAKNFVNRWGCPIVKNDHNTILETKYVHGMYPLAPGKVR